MIRFFRHWFASLDEIETELREHGYITVYGGGSSFVVPLIRPDMAPPPRRRRFLLWGAIPAAFGT